MTIMQEFRTKTELVLLNRQSAMFILNRALCSKDFRRVGIVHSSLNVFVQVICCIPLGIGIYQLSSHRYNKDSPFREYYYDVRQRNLFVSMLSFILLDIILYIWLIYGLASFTCYITCASYFRLAMHLFNVRNYKTVI